MELNMRVSGRITERMAMVNSGNQTSTLTKENGRMIRHMAITYICMLMELSVKDIGRMMYNGIEIWANGNKYEGSYVFGKKEGQGKYYWPEGNYHQGDWKENNINDHGTYAWSGILQMEGWVIILRRSCSRQIWSLCLGGWKKIRRILGEWQILWRRILLRITWEGEERIMGGWQKDQMVR
ncbi:unnamed protein product [Paramecium octaurelia]|uniref:Uncharacterized protein n=1 Tax=Paramecium octaurelia TaxID=43137 RepID=A0A8S1WT57_PAROT|nr:unnamed protein product [Paramecium octaurelia]